MFCKIWLGTSTLWTKTFRISPLLKVILDLPILRQCSHNSSFPQILHIVAERTLPQFFPSPKMWLWILPTSARENVNHCLWPEEAHIFLYSKVNIRYALLNNSISCLVSSSILLFLWTNSNVYFLKMEIEAFHLLIRMAKEIYCSSLVCGPRSYVYNYWLDPMLCSTIQFHCCCPYVDILRQTKGGNLARDRHPCCLKKACVFAWTPPD